LGNDGVSTDWQVREYSERVDWIRKLLVRRAWIPRINILHLSGQSLISWLNAPLGLEVASAETQFTDATSWHTYTTEVSPKRGIKPKRGVETNTPVSN